MDYVHTRMYTLEQVQVKANGTMLTASAFTIYYYAVLSLAPTVGMAGVLEYNRV